MSGSAQGPMMSFCEHGNKSQGSVKVGNFLTS